jgi:hypothetical protein
MDESAEIVSQYAFEIQRSLEAIDNKLADQFGGADGLTYTAKLIHGLVATMQRQVTTISSVNLAAWICAIATVAHVVHHW